MVTLLLRLGSVLISGKSNFRRFGTQEMKELIDGRD